MLDPESIRNHLQNAIHQCNVRCLKQSSKWLSEQLLGMDSSTKDDIFADTSCGVEHEPITQSEFQLILFSNSLISNGEYQRCADLMRNTHKHRVKSMLGKFLSMYSFYMAGEQLKDQTMAESIVADMPSSSAIMSKSANSASGGKNQKDDSIQAKQFSAKNPYLNDLYKELSTMYYSSDQNMDGYLLYLFAVITRDIRRQGTGSTVDLFDLNTIASDFGVNIFDHEDTKMVVPESESAYHIFLQSLCMNPWNWSCWLELFELCSSEQAPIPSWKDVLAYKNSRKKKLIQSTQTEDEEKEPESVGSDNDVGEVMHWWFLTHCYLDRQLAPHTLRTIEMLAPIFPGSNTVVVQTALAHYVSRDYDRALETFEIVRSTDQYRLEHIDTYSNILYVKEARPELSQLAHRVAKINKYSPECCMVIGNYYSLKGQHERAITYFQRALRLNSSCLSAWTLMGHEYVELKNTAAAVQCYRRAVQSSAREFRAWYGLGQTYEMLHMYQYALYYYKKAAASKPTDSRMWSAVGHCACRLGNKRDAMTAFERAVDNDDRESIATRELARLYREFGFLEKAAGCYFRHLKANGFINENLNLTAAVQGIVIDRDMSEGLLFVANFLRKNGHYERSESFCNLLVDYGGQPEREEARSILREIRSILQEQSSLQGGVSRGTPSAERAVSNIRTPSLGGRLHASQESQVNSPMDNVSGDYGSPSSTSEYDQNLLSMSLSPALSED